jgi:hypothetical protein
MLVMAMLYDDVPVVEMGIFSAGQLALDVMIATATLSNHAYVV